MQSIRILLIFYAILEGVLLRYYYKDVEKLHIKPVCFSGVKI